MIYHITKGDIAKAAHVLSKSFMNYPTFTYIMPDPVYRKDNLEFVFSFLLTLGLCTGDVVAPTSNLEGVSIWIDSSKKSSLIQVLKDGVIPLFMNLDLISIYRFFNVGIQKKYVRKKILHDSYFMLDVIGTDPQYQHQGFAHQMIDTTLKEYDTQSMPCYLETSDKENISFYKTYGFNILHEYHFQGIKVYCLLRNSRSTNIITD